MKYTKTIFILLLIGTMAVGMSFGISACDKTDAVSANIAVFADEPATDEEITAEETTEPETAEIEVEDEQTTSEELDEVADKELGESEARVEIPETEQPQDETVGEGADRHNGFIAYGIWSGEYWHFTPEQIDHRWNGMKSSKPDLPEGTTRAWQRYLYDKLVSIGAEHFYKIAVAQAMQESGMNPLNQQGKDAVPDKGLFSFRIWYWNPAYGDIYDYHANIDAYIARVLPYLADSSDQGIYRAISQHYQPDGTIHMNYVQHVLGRLGELWEVE